MKNALAFDRASVRSYDADKRLHVASTNISKANVCGYLGKEIPDFESLGLDAEKIYQLYRDPDELAKAAPSFNNIPLLSKHTPVSAADHQPDLVIGSTGTDAEFDAPYLKNSLVIWAQDAIDAIEAESQKELSSAYRYRADMTPGEIDGEKYDGVMRDIIGNHVALVQEGRAGPDVVVGDAALKSSKETPNMKKTITRRGRARAGIEKAVGVELAQDANLGDLTKLLDALDDIEPAEDAEADIDIKDAKVDAPKAEPDKDNKAKDEEESAFDAEPVRAFCKDKMSADDFSKLEELLGPKKAEDAETEEVKAEDEDDDKKDKKDMVTKPAMDAAIAAAVKINESHIVKRMHAAMDAREFVRPHVGNLPLALDSAESVLRAAAEVLAIPSAKTVHESALRDLIAMKVAAKPAREPARLAQDAAGVKSYAEMFPDAARIKTA